MKKKKSETKANGLKLLGEKRMMSVRKRMKRRRKVGVREGNERSETEEKGKYQQEEI